MFKFGCASRLYARKIMLLSCKHVMPQMNQSIYNMILTDVTTGPDADGAFIIHRENGTVEFEVQEKEYNDQLYCHVKLTIYQTGDLVYLATILGKDNSSGWHCPYCKLGHKNGNAKDMSFESFGCSMVSLLLVWRYRQVERSNLE